MICFSTKCPVYDCSEGIDTTTAERCFGVPKCGYFSGSIPKKTQIDHPAYYQGSHECIDLMREIYGDDAVRSFCICNAYKYRFRAGKKKGESAQTDIAKAEWYEAYVMEHLMRNTTLEFERFRSEWNKSATLDKIITEQKNA